MGEVERYRVEFVTFQLLGDAKLWWWAFVEYRPVDYFILTWTQFYSIFLDMFLILYETRGMMCLPA